MDGNDAGNLAGLRAEVARLKAEKSAVTTLLYTDEVFVGSHWEDYPHAEKGTWPALCAHVWSYGADAEEIPEGELVPLAGLVEAFGTEAIQAWVCFRRGLGKPVKGRLGPRGQEALELLASQGGLVQIRAEAR